MYTRSTETIYLSLRPQVAVGTFFIKSPVSYLYAILSYFIVSYLYAILSYFIVSYLYAILSYVLYSFPTCMLFYPTL